MELTKVTTRNIDDKNYIIISGCITHIGSPKIFLTEIQAAILYKQLQDFLKIEP